MGLWHGLQLFVYTNILPVIWTNIRWEHITIPHLLSALCILCKLREVRGRNLCEKATKKKNSMSYAESSNSMLGITLEFCILTCTMHQGPNPAVQHLWAALCSPPNFRNTETYGKLERVARVQTLIWQLKQEIYQKNNNKIENIYISI